MATTVHIDTETRSEISLDLGLDRYCLKVRVIIATWSVNRGPVNYWDITQGHTAALDELLALCADPDVTFIAHNAQFDRTVLEASLLFGLNAPALSQWHCTMAQAYAHGLPGSLDALGPILGLSADSQKLKTGKYLIQLFCVKHKGKPWARPEDHPKQWQQFIDYAIQDVAALIQVHDKLPKYNYNGEHLKLWHVDQRINERGFMVDRELCQAAFDMGTAFKEDLNVEIAELTNGEITAGTQRARIHNSVVGDYGLLMLDLTKDSITTALQDKTVDPTLRRLLEIRMTSAMTSLAKYPKAIARAGKDGRMRYTLQYAGAGRTGRWAGRGIQPHNMPRPLTKPEVVEGEYIPAIMDGTLPQKTDDMNQALSDTLRSMIVAGPGNELIVGDWSNIEGRVAAWIASEKWKLQAFRENDAGTGPDLYRLLYSKLFGVPHDSDQVNRQAGKAFELAFGFGGGVGATVMAANMYRIDLPTLAATATKLAPPEIYNKADKNWKRAFIRSADFELDPDVFIGADIAKQMYRKANPEIAQMWWELQRKVNWAIEKPGSVHSIARCKIWRTKSWLIIELPSTRRLYYAEPRVGKIVEFDPQTEELEERSTISFMTAGAKQWRRERTYGGKLFENIVQAIANDVLRASLLASDDEGWPIVLHVHDELVADAPQGFFELKDLLELMERPLWWTEGLPLKAAGYTSLRYKKD